jgi:hypothetical protein
MESQISAYEMAEKKLGEVAADIVELRRKKTALDEEEKLLIGLFQAWHQISEWEKPAIEVSASYAEEAGEGHSVSHGDLVPPQQVSYGGLIGFDPEKSYGARTEKVKEFLTASGERGMSPKEITEEFEKFGIAISKSFVGATLFRMKQRGEVVTRDGKYILNVFAPASKSATPEEGA